MTETTEVAELTFEQALGELDEVIRQLETGTVDLEESIARYDRGVLLMERCRSLLAEIEQKVTRLVAGPGGQLTEVPMGDPAADS